jgi:hypothetical protein
MEQSAQHRCLIYDGAPSLQLSVLAAVAVEYLRANYRCLYLNSPTMVAGMRTYLAAAGVEVATAVQRGALVLTSDQDHLIDGDFDVDRMLALLDHATKQALSDGYVGLWASGDMSWEFGAEKNLTKLLAYEVGLEELMRTQRALRGICQYHRDILPVEAVQVALYAHPTLFINETLSRLNPHYHQIGDSLNAARADIQCLAEIRAPATLDSCGSVP